MLMHDDVTLTKRGWTLMWVALAAAVLIGLVVSPPPDACAKDPACPVHDHQQ